MTRPNQKIFFHDPLIIEEAGMFYAFSTDINVRGVQMSKSKDLLNWTEPEALIKTCPSEISNHVSFNGFWAPELVRRNGEYRLYTSASAFGKKQSVISLFVAERISGPYVYKGNVIASFEQNLDVNAANAIDANVISDNTGHDFLVYGSFFGGIVAVPLGRDGLTLDKNSMQIIAGGKHTAVEGPYIVYCKEIEAYILFVSYGSLSADYNIRIGIAKEILGPYYDSLGQELTNLDPVKHVGDKIIAGYNFDLDDEQAYMAPGHNSLLKRQDGLYLVHHIRQEFDVRSIELHIRKIYTLSNGAIVVSPRIYDGEEEVIENHLDESNYISIIRFDRLNNGVTYGRKLKLESLNLKYSDGEFSMRIYNQKFIGICIQHGNKQYLSMCSPTGERLWGRLFSRDKGEEI